MYILGIMYMLGNKKHVLKLRDSLLVLIEIVGLRKGRKAQKRGQRPSKMAEGPPRALRRS